ncbi:ATP-binding protein [Hymenobacter sp. GOD-10R]|uniref:tetratricopeptide repeat-containing sensor histidine kinase n=1 Tax=Hymenobacter sp. GOD-10R TaxID=3093922 RepID=UPI002D79C64B|nr:ATP-binding protein [Hymenobacter sp. GOD-10R]WRQ27383.1 ATP-binding protein [Hymenobacter sp. GOD-10R]
MKQRLRYLFFLFALLGSLVGRAQSPQTALLRRALAQATSDTSRVLLLADVAASYRYSRFDSVQWYARKGLHLAWKIGYRKGEGRCLSRIGILMGERGNLPQALRTDLKALKINEESRDLEGTARTLNQTGLLYHALDDERPALAYFFRSKSIYEQIHIQDDSQLISVLANIGASYTALHQLDSATVFLNRAYQLTRQSRNVHQSCWGNPAPYVLRELGLLQGALGHTAEAIRYYRLSAQAAIPENDLRSSSRAYQYLAELYDNRQQHDSSVYYARKALVMGQSLPFVVGVVRTSNLLAEAFQTRKQRDSTLKYMNIMLRAEDSLYDPQRIKQLDAIGFAEQQRLRELEIERVHYMARMRMYALAAGLAVLLLVALLLWRNNKLQKQANAKLQALNQQVVQQKEEFMVQRDNLARTLLELKQAQSQLVLREKMASLGELMASVAQEIQKPVHQVRDFAGISEALCQELHAEFNKLALPNDDWEYLDETLQNLRQYQEKIVQAGRRANSIVLGMLEYASAEPSLRQATELNTMIESNLRMAYHEMRGKHRTFNAALLPTFDPAVGILDVVRHDLSRALIQLFLTAFQAVQQRQSLDEEGYVPQVAVSTRRSAKHVEIRVRDNGLGLPKDLQGSMFQRFSTANTTNDSPGLGLPLSYDIIKSHGGALRVESLEGEFTEFIITLPVKAQLEAVASANASAEG